MDTVQISPPIGAWIYGHDVELIASWNGCGLYLVRREWERTDAHRAAGTPYWTVLVQTMPGRDKSMRFFGLNRSFGEQNPERGPLRALLLRRLREHQKYSADMRAAGYPEDSDDVVILATDEVAS